jgi:hypothetical protein
MGSPIRQDIGKDSGGATFELPATIFKARYKPKTRIIIPLNLQPGI